jgi:hypothetical protein
LVKLVFENSVVIPHNLLIVQPGAADEVGMAGNGHSSRRIGVLACQRLEASRLKLK